MPNYKPGLGNVGSYQVSGYPWVTGSTGLIRDAEDAINFPRVAKSVTIINADAANQDIQVHYNSISDSGDVITGSHYVLLNSALTSISLSTKCRQIFISAPVANDGVASYTVIADLTSIESGLMQPLTGAGLTCTGTADLICPYLGIG